VCERAIIIKGRRVRDEHKASGAGVARGVHERKLSGFVCRLDAVAGLARASARDCRNDRSYTAAGGVERLAIPEVAEDCFDAERPQAVHSSGIRRAAHQSANGVPGLDKAPADLTAQEACRTRDQDHGTSECPANRTTERFFSLPAAFSIDPAGRWSR
jgi:hypothetical protein